MIKFHRNGKTAAARRVCIVILGLFALLALTTAVAFAAPTTQDPVAGETTWGELSCKNCHGESGEGMWAGPLAGHEKTAEEWIAQVRTPRRNMPNFTADQVPDQAVMDVHAYLTALEKPADFAPAEADLPADAPAGQLLIVEKRCVACHSTTGPVRGFQTRGEVPTAELVLAQLRTPRNNMPSFTVEQVSDEEAGQIAEFLAVQVEPESLPASGGTANSALPAALLTASAVLLLAGFLWRYRLAHS